MLDCCARTASGDATPKAAIPSMKVRRRIADPKAQGLCGPCYGMPQLQQGFAIGETGSLMFALGQKQTSRRFQSMSALPPKADIGTQLCNVCFVPEADIASIRSLQLPARQVWPQCTTHVRFGSKADISFDPNQAFYASRHV
jgi:hypothetical protein